MTVYIDEFAVLNVISDWAVLALTGKMCGMEVKPFKIAQALAIGLIYGVMALLLPVFSALSFKILFGILVYVAAFGAKEAKAKNIAVFFVSSSFFAGAVSAANGVFPKSTLVFTVTFAVCYYLAGFALERLFISPGTEMGIYKKAAVELDGSRKAEFTVMLDTGNLLRDPITGCGVMIAEVSALNNILNGQEKRFLEDCRMRGVLEALSCYSPGGTAIKFSPIFYSSVGGNEVAAPLFYPKYVTVGSDRHTDIPVMVTWERINAAPGCRGIIGVMK